MTRTEFVIFIILLALGLAVLGAPDFFATPIWAATGVTSTLPPIRADQARANIGQNVTVQGVAHSEQADARLGFYVDLDSTGPSPLFAGYVPNENVRQFPALESLNGHLVEITGVIRMREGYPIITMTDSTQLRILR